MSIRIGLRILRVFDISDGLESKLFECMLELVRSFPLLLHPFAQLVIDRMIATGIKTIILMIKHTYFWNKSMPMSIRYSHGSINGSIFVFQRRNQTMMIMMNATAYSPIRS